ncbi:MAG: hypothetical protein ABIS06_00890 [Vicinamibacterales bacterium]
MSTNVVALMITAALAAGQQKEASQADDVRLPVSVSKIQKAISRPPAIKTDSDRTVFRVEVFARKPTVADILGPDYLKGPVAYGGMTHQEFLNMVTPVEYRGYSMFTNGEGMMIAATSLALQWTLMKAIDKLKDAKNDRAKEAARKEVLEAMNELERARQKAGLPPKTP